MQETATIVMLETHTITESFIFGNNILNLFMYKKKLKKLNRKSI